MYFVVQAQVRLSTLTAMVSELEERDRQLASLGQWVTDQRTQVSVSSNSNVSLLVYIESFYKSVYYLACPLRGRLKAELSPWASRPVSNAEHKPVWKCQRVHVTDCTKLFLNKLGLIVIYFLFVSVCMKYVTN